MSYPFFHKSRARRYKFATSILNLLSSTSNFTGYPREVNIDWASIKRIGIFCQWGIGDAILMYPLLKALRKVTNAKIELIGKPWLRELYMAAGMCDHVHPCFPPWTKFKNKYLFCRADWRKYIEQFRRLRRNRLDLLISVRYDPREVLQLRLLTGGTRAAYSACGGKQWLDIDFGVNPSMAQMRHVANDAALAAEILTKQNIDPVPLLNVPSKNIRRSCKWMYDNGYRGGVFLAVSPGAGNPVRRWPSYRYNEVLKDLPSSVGFIIVILPLEDNGEADIQWPSSIPGAYWKGSLSELQNILSITDILLTVDSGIMHVGAAYGCRVVAIFGPQLEQWFGPCTPTSEIIMVDPMPCRPCFDKCIYGTPICMKKIKEEAVKEAVYRAVEKIRDPRINFYYNRHINKTSEKKQMLL